MDLPVDTFGLIAVDADRVRRAARWRRALFFTLTLLTAAVATGMMCDILAANGLTDLKDAGLVLFYVLFVWITGAFWTALAGFMVRLRGGDPLSLKPGDLAGRPVAGRTAILMPIYNEDTTRVAAGLDVIWSSLARLPEQAAFEAIINLQYTLLKDSPIVVRECVFRARPDRRVSRQPWQGVERRVAGSRRHNGHDHPDAASMARRVKRAAGRKSSRSSRSQRPLSS